MVDLSELRKSRDMGGHVDRLYQHCIDVNAKNILEFKNNGNVTSVDIRNCTDSVPFDLKCRWTFIQGDSQNVDTVLEICTKIDKKTLDVLFIDGDHTIADKDLARYKHLVRKGGLIVLHDSDHEPNVIKTVEEMMQTDEYDIVHYSDCFGLTVAEVL
jgi:23S rRNA U2552 (ribose-2'-O)-methylase RlmE/FtsJ